MRGGAARPASSLLPCSHSLEAAFRLPLPSSYSYIHYVKELYVFLLGNIIPLNICIPFFKTFFALYAKKILTHNLKLITQNSYLNPLSFWGGYISFKDI